MKIPYKFPDQDKYDELRRRVEYLKQTEKYVRPLSMIETMRQLKLSVEILAHSAQYSFAEAMHNLDEKLKLVFWDEPEFENKPKLASRISNVLSYVKAWLIKIF